MLIWEEALRLPTAPIIEHDAQSGIRTLPTRAVDTDASVIGWSCVEARRQMQQLCRKLTPVSHSLVSASSTYWYIPQSTMFCLADLDSAMLFLELYDTEQLLEIKYIALAWTRFDSLARMCMAVAKMCPTLDTMFIVRCELNPFSTTTASAELQKSLDVCFGVMQGHTNTLLADAAVDTNHFRSLLVEYFDSSAPKMHFLSQKAVSEASQQDAR